MSAAENDLTARLRPQLDIARWPRRTWIYAVGTVFLLQLVLIAFVGQRGQSGPPARQRLSTVYLAADAISLEQISKLPLLCDPAALALPNWNGFSRAGWLEFAHPQFRLAEWSEPPQWLTINPAGLTEGFRRFVETNTIAPLLIADKPLPRMRRPDSTLVGNAPVRSQSELRVHGELANWTMVDAAALPSWPHTELLTNTVVQTVVDGRGYTVGATLLFGCGLPDADRSAVRTARNARFLPPAEKLRQIDASTIVVGKLVFKWHTLPAATNVVSPGTGAAP